MANDIVPSTRPQTEIETRYSPNGHDGGGSNQAEVIKHIVDHLIKARGLELLQITPLPKNAIFDISYDITQEAILNEERIKNKVPLRSIWREAYFMAIRGSNGMLGMTLMDIARIEKQVQVEEGGENAEA